MQGKHVPFYDKSWKARDGSGGVDTFWAGKYRILARRPSRSCFCTTLGNMYDMHQTALSSLQEVRPVPVKHLVLAEYVT